LGGEDEAEAEVEDGVKREGPPEVGPANQRKRVARDGLPQLFPFFACFPLQLGLPLNNALIVDDSPCFFLFFLSFLIVTNIKTIQNTTSTSIHHDFPLQTNGQ
jgi:hypothetical protein